MPLSLHLIGWIAPQLLAARKQHAFVLGPQQCTTHQHPARCGLYGAPDFADGCGTLECSACSCPPSAACLTLVHTRVLADFVKIPKVPDVDITVKSLDAFKRTSVGDEV